jgi:hypothetical protein
MFLFKKFEKIVNNFDEELIETFFKNINEFESEISL